MIHGVIFDFNGTLFFDTKYHLQVFDQLSYELTGKHLTEDEYESKYAGVPNIEIFRKMTNNALSEEEYVALSIRKEQMYRDVVRNIEGGAKLCDGAEELFTLLKANHIPFTIASASILENIQFFFEIFHLDQWFDRKQVVYDDGSYINKEKMFQEACLRLNVKDHIIVFEDSLSGMQCAAKIHAKLFMIENIKLQNEYDKYPVIQKIHSLSDSIEKIEELINE